MLADYKKAYKHICETDKWDDTLWYLYQEKDGDNTFCGNAKEINQAFCRGLYIAINEPDNFESWNEGFIAGCSWGIDTITEWYLEKVAPEQD
jgi:hypothetical protein